jgi:MFS family permease
MSATINSSLEIPWWKEPSREQWKAWIAAWLGWTLDAFDFTIFLLIMVPIAKEFDVSLTAVTAVFTITLWLRLVGATAAGWMADRMGRKTPLMISILWYSLCNFIAGFSPTFAFLFFFRALLGIGMGAEWPAGAALAMESWPARSRGLMSGVLQGSWALGFALSSLAYGFLFDLIGWRGLLWIGGIAGPRRGLDPVLRERAQDLGREQTPTAGNEDRGEGAFALHLQARHVVQYADGLLLARQHHLRLLFDLGAVFGISAEGAELDAADGGNTCVLGQHRRLCRQ